MERVLKVVGTVVAIGTLLFAILQFASTQAIEAEKPFLERKLAWCEEAVSTAAAISVWPDGASQEKILRFWELYWGVMGMVEGKAVTKAMIAFGNRLRENNIGDKKLALEIAHACRKELAADWSPVWR